MYARLASALVALTIAFSTGPAPAQAAPAPAKAAVVVLAPVPHAGVVAGAGLARYRVAPGDTLWAIAARYCGTGSAFPNLAAASGITNANRIQIGWRITLACKPPRPQPAGYAAPAPSPARLAKVLAYALAKVGDRYVWAAAGPYAFDCSGLVMMAYRQIGIRLPHQSEQMLSYGKRVTRNELRPGDVVWPFHGHVMLYVGNGYVVEAANPTRGVIRSKLYGFITARRLVY